MPDRNLSAADKTAGAELNNSRTEKQRFNFLAPPEQDDEIGRLGKYRILEVLGSGGMGIVFRAEEHLLKRMVALKVMKPSVATKPQSRTRFLREAQATAALSHDHIVQIYLVGEERGAPFIAMQYLAGQSLQTVLEKAKKLRPIDVVRIGAEVASGLAAAHEKGLIHRDIKPDNIHEKRLRPIAAMLRWEDQRATWHEMTKNLSVDAECDRECTSKREC